MIPASVRLATVISINIADKENERTWSTGFIATPRVLGQEFRFTANLCFALDASVMDVSQSLVLFIRGLTHSKEAYLCVHRLQQFRPCHGHLT